MAELMERRQFERRIATLRFLERSCSSDMDAILLRVVEQASWLSLNIANNPRLRRSLDTTWLEQALTAFAALGEDGEEQSQR